MKKTIHRVVTGVFASVIGWVETPHPFLYFGMVLGLPVWIFFCVPAYLKTVSHGGEADLVFLRFFMLMLYVFCTGLALMLIGVSAQVGARVFERCYWVPTTENSGRVGQQEKWFAELRDKGYREVPLTYTGVLRWSAKGFWLAGLPILGVLYLLWWSSRLGV